MDELVEIIAATYPSCSDLASMFVKWSRAVDDLTLEEFFEPTWAIAMAEGKSSKMLGMAAGHVQAWSLHIAYSTRIRLQVLERTILQNVLDRQCLPAMVLARSHMEVCGVAALCNETLYATQKDRRFDELEDLMLKTSLGTAMRRTAKKDKWPEGQLLLSEQNTIAIGKAIESLDTFRDSGFQCRRTYALLCEFAHPNPRANKYFYEASGDASSGGWRVRYGKTARFGEDEARMILKITSDNARTGHAVAELLRLNEIGDSADGVVVRTPGDETWARIWTNLLMMPQSDEENASGV